MILRPETRLMLMGTPGVSVVERAPTAAGVADWWTISGQTCVAAYQPKGAASLAASYSNLANPGTYDAVAVVAPSWASGSGWTMNGSTTYLTTGITAAINKSWSFVARYANISQINGIVLGSRGGTSAKTLIRARNALNKIGYGHGGEQSSASAWVASGVAAIAGDAGYLDGSLEKSGLGAWSGTAYPFYIGCENNTGGGTQSFCDGDIIAIAIYSTTLSSGDVAALSSAMAAL